MICVRDIIVYQNAVFLNLKMWIGTGSDRGDQIQQKNENEKNGVVTHQIDNLSNSHHKIRK